MMRALIVEPDTSEAERLAKLAERAHVRATVCADGEQALQHIDGADRLDLLVTQLSLPKVDGFDVLRRYRQRFPMPLGRAVALSSFVELRASAMADRRALGLDVVLAAGAPNDSILRVLTTLVSGAAMQVQRLRGLETTSDSPERTLADENARRATVRSRGLETLPITPPDPDLQRFTRRVSNDCNAPIGILSVARNDQLIFPARHGIDMERVDRVSALCDLVLRTGDPLFVPDAQRNPVARDNPAVRAGLVRGYASLAIRVDEGPPVGTVAIIDSEKPLKLGVDEVRILRTAARDAATMLVERARSGAVPHLRAI